MEAYQWTLIGLYPKRNAPVADDTVKRIWPPILLLLLLLLTSRRRTNRSSSSLSHKHERTLRTLYSNLQGVPLLNLMRLLLSHRYLGLCSVHYMEYTYIALAN